MELESNLAPKPKLFYERDSILSTVDRMLTDKSVLILHGRPGTGKTSLARSYAHQFLAKDPNNRLVLEFRCDYDRKLYDAYMEILKLSNRFVKNIMTLDKKPLIEQVNSILTSQNKQILLIYDHVESFDAVSDYILSLPSKFRVIVACRHVKVCNKFDPSRVNMLELDEFSRADFQGYLKENCSRLSQEQINNLFDLILKTGKSYDNEVTISPVNAHKAATLLRNNIDADLNLIFSSFVQNASRYFIKVK